jgi:hypothetical protein
MAASSRMRLSRADQAHERLLGKVLCQVGVAGHEIGQPAGTTGVEAVEISDPRRRVVAGRRLELDDVPTHDLEDP